MKRRRLLTTLPALAGAASLTAGLAACRREEPSGTGPAERVEREWKMVTTWPANFPIFGTAASRLAQRIERLSGGRIRVQVFGAGELVPAFEVFDSVSRGVAQIGHGAPAYWRGVVPAAPLFSGIPFGMTVGPFNAWLNQGGGAALWRETYAPFHLVPMAAGNTGMQMGGWYNREINRLEDFDGLKIRIAGLGAEVLQAIGATPVIIPGAELFTALQTGAIDATEFVGPHNDMAFGLHQVASHYYYPGWHEPSGMVECLVNAEALAGLPADLQGLVEEVCQAENDRVTAEFAARNQRALATIETLDIQLAPFPAEVLSALQQRSKEVLDQLALADPVVREVLDSQRAFQAESDRWRAITDQAYMNLGAA